MPKDDDLIDSEIRVIQQKIQELKEDLEPYVEATKKALFDRQNAGRNSGAVARAAKALREATEKLQEKLTEIDWYQTLLKALGEKKKAQPSGFDQGPGGGRPGMDEFTRGFGIGLGGGLPGGPGTSDLFGGLGGGGLGGGASFGGGAGGFGGGGASPSSSSSGGSGAPGEWRDIDGKSRGWGPNPSARDTTPQGSEPQHADQPRTEGAQSSAGQHEHKATHRERHPSNQSTQTESPNARKPAAKTENPMNESSGLTGDPFLDQMTLQQLGYAGRFIPAPRGPMLGLTGEAGVDGRDSGGTIDWEMLDPVAPVAIYEGGSFGPRGGGPARTRFDNPFIEALYPDGSGRDDGEDPLAVLSAISGRPMPAPETPGDPAAMQFGANVVAVAGVAGGPAPGGGTTGAVLVEYSAGVTSPTIITAAGRAMGFKSSR